MQSKGLLNTGHQRRPKDSTGKRCVECQQVIESDHAHKQGRPYHKECL